LLLSTVADHSWAFPTVGLGYLLETVQLKSLILFNSTQTKTWATGTVKLREDFRLPKAEAPANILLPSYETKCAQYFLVLSGVCLMYVDLFLSNAPVNVTAFFHS